MKNTFKILFALILVLAMVFSFAACSENNADEATSITETTLTADDSANSTNENIAESNKTDTTTPKDETNSDLVKAEIEIIDYGTIKLDLYADEAPITVANFVKLAKNGFYNGLTFHRIMQGFMMQGGDPLGNGTGGSDEEIKGEFQANGHANSISHIRGTISMARSQSYDSASSQFFICDADSVFLDGQYAAFGRVTDGMNVVDKVCKKAKPTDSNGTIPKNEQPVIKTIKIIE